MSTRARMNTQLFPRLLAVTCLVVSLCVLPHVGCRSEGGAQESRAQKEEPPAPRTNPAAAADALRDAALEGRLQAVLSALSKGADVNAMDQERRSALMLAAFNGHTEVVRALIEKGASVNATDSMGRTALMFASSGPSPDTVRLLLENKADPDVQDSGEGWTALMFAAGEGLAEVVQVLLEHGADRTLKDVDGDTALDFAKKNGHMFVVRLLDRDGR